MSVTATGTAPMEPIALKKALIFSVTVKPCVPTAANLLPIFAHAAETLSK